MRKARTFVIAAASVAAVAALGVQAISVSTPQAEAVPNTISMYELHLQAKDLPVQEITDPI
jgi:Spy/CpxP family protein refolding chaperone